MTDSGSDATFEMGRVISRTFSVYGRNFFTFTLLSVLAALPIFAMYFYMGKLFTPSVAHTAPLQFAALLSKLGTFTITMLVGVIFAFILQAAVVYGAVSDLNGKRARFGECLTIGLRMFLPLIAVAILAILGFYLGLILLVIPGIMLIVSWAVIVPACVVEKTGVFGAFDRSRTLTSGHRWKIFGLFVIFYIGASLIGFALLPILGLNFQASGMLASTPYLILSSIVRVFTAIIGATGVASVYYELRLVKEGIGPQGLAAAFD